MQSAAFFLVSFSCFSAFAQNAPPPPSLKLRIEPVDIDAGVPKAFTFSIVNVSDHIIRLPKPSTPCLSRDYGWIRLHLTFTTTPPPQEGFGGGCGSQTGDGPDFFQRLQRWTVLADGESVKMTLSRAEMFQVESAPGRYEFWAEYLPPTYSADQQTYLANSGIDYAKDSLSSNHLVFERKRVLP